MNKPGQPGEKPINPDSKPPATPATAGDEHSSGLSAKSVRVFLGRVGPAGPLAIVASTLPAVGGVLLLVVLKQFGGWLESHGIAGVGLYVGAFALLAGLALLPTYAQAVLGGWAFGMPLGSAAALAGIGGAALVGYATAWRASGEHVISLIESNRKWKAVHRALVRGGFWKTVLIVALVRLPSTPFALTNLVMAVTRVSLPAYIIGTVLGIAPRTVVAAVIGAGMSDLDFGQAKNIWLIVVGVVGLLIVFGIIGQIANHAIERVTGEHEEPNSQSGD